MYPTQIDEISNPEFVVFEQDNEDNFGTEHAECMAELAKRDDPRYCKFYNDSYNHLNPVAEKAYRTSFAQSAIETLAILLDASLDACEIFAELYSLERTAKTARVDAREAADIGVHYGIYLVGHELEAARSRGLHHGLVSAIHLVESVETPVSDNEPTEAQFNAQQSAEMDRIRQHLAGYSAWVESVCRWAAGDCAEVEFHEFYFESKRKMGAMPQELLSVPGFVGEFVKHCGANAKREQPELAMATGLALLATLCGRKVVDEYDSRCNVFFVGLAGTSSGKEGPRKVAKDILFSCCRTSAVSESFASHAGLISAVSDSPDHLALVDEFGRYLATQNGKKADSHLSLIPTIMMRMFSSSNSMFVADRYSDTKRNPVVTILNPNLNVLGTTVSGNFFQALASENITDGLLNRYLVFEVSVDLPELRQVRTTALPQSLIDTAKQWSELVPGTAGVALPSPVVIPEEQSATDLFDRFSAFCDGIARSERSPICRGLWPRTYEKARKLAMLYACSESFASPRITTAGAAWGIAFATHCTEFVERAAGSRIADNDHQRSAKLVLRIITESGKAGITQAKLYRRIDHTMKSRDLREILVELGESGEIRFEDVSTKGRPVRMLIAV